MGIKDFLKRGSGLDLVGSDEGSDDGKDERPSGVAKESKKSKAAKFQGMTKGDVRMLRQLEGDLSRAIEKLEDARDKLRVRRGY